MGGEQFEYCCRWLFVFYYYYEFFKVFFCSIVDGPAVQYGGETTGIKVLDLNADNYPDVLYSGLLLQRQGQLGSRRGFSFFQL